MTLIRWEPTRELQSVHQEMNRLFGSFFDSPSSGSIGGSRRWVPAVDLSEDEHSIVLRADLPGLKSEDVAVEIDNGVLTLSGERKSEHDESKQGYRRLERSFGRFSRALRLPEGIDADSVEASFEDGVLEVTIPKPEQPKPRRVAISGAEREQVVQGADSTS